MFDGASGGGGAGMQSETAQLSGASTDADSCATELDGMLTSLMNNLEPLMTEWRGAGGQSFQNVRDSCELEMKNLNDALRRLSGKIGNTSNAYSESDYDMSTVVNNSGAEAGGITNALTA